MEKAPKNILIIAATMPEINPLIGHLQETYNRLSGPDMLFERKGLLIRVEICGIGMVATAFNLARVLTTNTFDCVIQLGIGGAYPTAQIDLGAVVYITAERIGDLGASTKEGDFLSLQQIGLEEHSAGTLPGNPPAALTAFLQQLLPAEGISVNHISGNAGWRNRFNIAPDIIVAESMEGAGLHYACTAFKVPFVQVRSISNWVEPRDKSRWQMGSALQNLNKTAITLLQYL
ncbi:MAG: futalosine hydrolase [Sphingobacteriales bacterium]|nr:MAG: futalosine hydrolase [Sphingobacteriales bacterium]